jgi:hypothetical protein
MECDVSSNVDPSSEPTWSGDEPIMAVDWSDMSGSSMPSPPHMVEVTSLRQPEPITREKNAGSSLRSAAQPVRKDQQAARTHTAPGGPSASETLRDPPRQADPPWR